MPIPFNKPFMVGSELAYIQEAVASGKLAGDGVFTRRCQEFFETRWGYAKALLTPSCTAALEMAAILLDIGPGDEVIMPSFTFVSTANAFVLRGAHVVFADCQPDFPNIDADGLQGLITDRTRAIVVVHYAGVACDMDAVRQVAHRHGLPVIEDAAQSIDATYKGLPLGTLGDLSCFSFHETKNVISGEGGLLGINRPELVRRAEIIREKGTNRAAFYRGDVDKYSWVDIGSSYLPSEIVAAYLWAQLEQLGAISARRRHLYARYRQGLAELENRGLCQLPQPPVYGGHNAHIFYLVCADLHHRDRLLQHLRAAGVHATFHYVPLHSSPFYNDRHDGRVLTHADRFADCLVRLPLYFSLTTGEQDRVISAIKRFYMPLRRSRGAVRPRPAHSSP